MIDKKTFLNPQNKYRPYRMLHSYGESFQNTLREKMDEGFGGFVVNSKWYDFDEKDKYLCCDEDFKELDENMALAEKMGAGLWLYDEKGYPSGSADGLTLRDHPEYQAKGFTELVPDVEHFTLPEGFEKIVYACKSDGSSVEFDEKSCVGADRCYAVKSVFEGSHAQKCGYGPRLYPNLLDKRAIASFIECTYDKYYEKLRNFNLFEAVFTDEPSLMSAYVNCKDRQEYAFLPWQDELPTVFNELFGENFFSHITQLFDTSDTFSEGKLKFYKTVSHMINEAFFGQIRDWCVKHGIKFSGHALLEECISMHVPLYGNLLQALKCFDIVGVDMLTGSPTGYRFSEQMKYTMAPRFVGSAARLTGKTQKAMVEICPLVGHNGNKEYSFEEEVGTMDLIFRAGINHINSYLDAKRLNGKFPRYSDYFARCAYILRECDWNGKIGVYYPIETMQGFYHPDKVGVNSGAHITPTEARAEKSMFDLCNEIDSNSLDSTIIDADFVLTSEINGGIMKRGKLEISAVVMPAVRYLEEKVYNRLKQFEKSGGLVVWADCVPDGKSEKVSENPISELKKSISYEICVKAQNSRDLLVGQYLRQGKRVYYIINSSGENNKVEITFPSGQYEFFYNSDGSISCESDFLMKPYTSVFACEK